MLSPPHKICFISQRTSYKVFLKLISINENTLVVPCVFFKTEMHRNSLMRLFPALSVMNNLHVTKEVWHYECFMTRH